MVRKKVLLLLLVGLVTISCFAQNIFSCIVQDAGTKEPLADVSVLLKGSGKGATSDANGKVLLKNIPAGKQVLVFSSIGYKEQSIEINFPISGKDPLVVITLEPEEKEIEKVIIASSRTDSRIENTVTRVEVLGAEEVEEESGVKPAHVANLLGDVAGIQNQQLSAVTGSTDLRIQGLPGDYTQILRDGLPLFGGYAGSFSILQIQPLDLKQVEIIKGASSTLYGGGAIAGLINIISKKPLQDVPERSLLLNYSTLKEYNLNLYLSERNKKQGYTFFSGGTFQKQMDKNRDDFSDVARVEGIFLHPTFFFYPNEKNTFSIGVNSNFEDRKGGDMLVLADLTSSRHQFFIQNQSYRNTIHAIWDNRISRTDKFTMKANMSTYKRNITTNVFSMKARQISFYTEASYVKKKEKHDVVAGINLNGDVFKKHLPDTTPIRNYHYFTLGLFIQDDWKIHPKFTVEGGLRSDFHNKYGVFLLPRISLLYKLNRQLTTRLGGGMGYLVPTVFGDELDERDYARLQPLINIKAERSSGINWDINFKKTMGDVSVTINQSFYITQISHTLVIQKTGSSISWYNEVKPIVTKGIETWLQVAYEGMEAYLGYTITDAQKKYDPVHPYLELSARNKFASVISYEFSKHFRGCIEASYTGRKYLEGGSRSPSFLIAAAMLQYKFSRFSFVLNCENLFNYRQTKKESIALPPTVNPRFKQLWAPIDGRVANLSMKLRL